MKYIFQTWKRHDLSEANPIFRISQESWKKQHPAWEYEFFDDDEICALVKKLFPVFYQKYFSKYIGQIKRVDIFRYCNLFKSGGIYSDLDGEALQPFDPLMEQSFEHAFGVLKNENSPNGIPNAFMFTRIKKSNFWLFVLAMAVEHFENNCGYHSTEYLTGPVLTTKAVHAYESMSIEEINTYILTYFPDRVDYCNNSKEEVLLLPHDIIYPIDWQQLNGEERKEITRKRIEENNLPMEYLGSQALTMNYWTYSWTVPKYSLWNRIQLRIRYYSFKIQRSLAQKRSSSEK